MDNEKQTRARTTVEAEMEIRSRTRAIKMQLEEERRQQEEYAGATLGATELPPRLANWNPLDHLRLLLWVLYQTPRYFAFRREYKAPYVYLVTAATINTFTWLPLILALSTGMLYQALYGEESFVLLTFAILSGMALFTALTVNAANRIHNSGALALSGFLSLSVAVASGGLYVVFVSDHVLALLAFGMMLGAAVSLADTLPGEISATITTVVAFGVTFGAVFGTADLPLVAGTAIGGLIFSAMMTAAIRQNLAGDSPRLLCHVTGGALLLAALLLVSVPFIA